MQYSVIKYIFLLFVINANLTLANQIEDFRPVYKLRSDLQCWPSFPNNGINSGECRTKEQFTKNPPPVYYEVYPQSLNGEQINGKSHKLITYWAYYSNQNSCTTLDSGHSDDWEAITVHLVDNQMRHITYWQHNGRYTLDAKDIEKDGTHPIVYVGKYAHGNYHDQRKRTSTNAWSYSTGTYCYYWRDPRGPGETWALGVKPLSSIGEESVFSGSTNPLQRGKQPHEYGVCKEDGGSVIAGFIDGTENTCKRNPAEIKIEATLLKELFYL